MPDSWEANRDQSVDPALLLRQPLPRPPRERSRHRVRRGQLRGQSRADARRPQLRRELGDERPGARAGARRRRHGRHRACPDGDHDNNANFLTLPDGLPGLMQMYLTQPPAFGALRRRERRDHRLPRVHTRALEPARHRRRGLRRAERAAGGRVGRGLERLLRDGLPRRPGARGRRPRHRGRARRPLHRQRHRLALPAARDRLHARGLAASPTAISATSRAGPTCTTTARSGRQTLWSIRAALIDAYADRLADPVAGRAAGIANAREYVTEGMRLAPPEPSFLDIRNALLQAAPDEDDEVMWTVFADRGMGYFAGSDGSDDVEPTPDDTDPTEFEGFADDQRHGRGRERRPARRRDGRDRRVRHGARPAAHGRLRGRRVVLDRGRADVDRQDLRRRARAQGRLHRRTAPPTSRRRRRWTSSSCATSRPRRRRRAARRSPRSRARTTPRAAAGRAG